MRRHLIHFLLVAILTVCSAATAFAQTTVKGQVVDAETGEPLVGAAIMWKVLHKELSPILTVILCKVSLPMQRYYLSM